MYLCRCSEVPIEHHKRLIHNGDALEAGVPCYEAQLKGRVRVVICATCHGLLPGHRIREVAGFYEKWGLNGERISKLLRTLEETSGLDDVLDVLPPASTAVKAWKRERIKKIWGRCVNCEFNPVRGHAGRMLKLCYEQEKEYATA